MGRFVSCQKHQDKENIFVKEVFILLGGFESTRFVLYVKKYNDVYLWIDVVTQVLQDYDYWLQFHLKGPLIDALYSIMGIVEVFRLD